MTPTALILALTIVVLPPDPTTGTDGPVRGSQATIGGQGGHGGDNNYRVLAGVAGSIIPGGGRNDGTPGTLAQQHVPLYVHALDRPAVDVDGLDPQFLAESVPIMLAESRGNNAAQRTDMVQGRPYTSYCILQILVDGATGPLIARMGGTVEQLRTDVAFCLAVGQEWKRLTDNGVPWRKWTTRGKYVAVETVGSDFGLLEGG